MKKVADDFIKSLRETISIAIEAHELMIADLSKASQKVKRLQKENQKLKENLAALQKSAKEKEE